MGCNVSRPSPSGGDKTAPKYESTEKQWQQQHHHQIADVAMHHPDSRLMSNPVETNNSLMNSAVGVMSPPTGEHTARTLPAFSFVNGGLMGVSSPSPQQSSQTSSNAMHHTRLNPIAIRAYGINAYYIYIHPYLPLFPPPAIPQYEDCPIEVIPLSDQPDRSILPFWPTSALGLALSALLVLIPLPKEPDPLSEPATVLRRSYAQLYVRSAEQTFEHSTEHRQFNVTAYLSNYALRPSSPLHPNMPANLEPILALLVLTVYDYCQRGNRKHMRSRAHQALTAAMDLSLHTMDPEAADAEKRAWWMTMYLASQSSISNHSAPIMLMHDPRITTPYPEFRSHHEPWPLLMQAQNALMQAGSIAKELAKKTNKTNLSRTTAEDIQRLDSTVLGLAIQLDTSRYVMNQEGAEACAARNLWAIALLFVHTARIKLHRFTAFGDCPLLLDKSCDLKTANFSNFTSSSSSSPGPPQAWALDVDSTFPFTTQESTDICLRSALVLSRILRTLPPPNPGYVEGVSPSHASVVLNGRPAANLGPQYPRSLPYLTCCTMQSCYVLVMLLRRLRASLCSGDLSTCYYLLRCAQAGTEIQDAERAIEELRNGIESLWVSLKSDSVFEGIVPMVRDVETIYTAYFSQADICTAPF
ncbi:hypothetical protein BDW59DRAFT_167197 [Aspergillus cavernicola]|uniref:Transcription factor domain-containing protein n=1 Tax=Aspergillus cavernicola TaxID=176166 RepID=A0ABR4HFV8_9EURO